MINIYNIKTYITMMACCIGILSCNTPFENASVSIIPHQEQVQIEIDGDISDWKHLEQTFSVEHFHAPWYQGEYGKTSFKSISDGEWVYFYFEAEDETSVLAPFSREEDVAKGDRVEFFVSGDPELGMYYCFELAPNGYVLDYYAKHYRKFDNSWNLESLQFKTKITESGYQVEGKLPVSFLKTLDPQATDDSCTISLGLYRADYVSLEENTDDVNWITWIVPNVEEPDFHVPSSFQKVTLMY